MFHDGRNDANSYTFYIDKSFQKTSQTLQHSWQYKIFFCLTIRNKVKLIPIVTLHRPRITLSLAESFLVISTRWIFISIYLSMKTTRQYITILNNIGRNWYNKTHCQITKSHKFGIDVLQIKFLWRNRGSSSRCASAIHLSSAYSVTTQTGLAYVLTFPTRLGMCPLPTLSTINSVKNPQPY